MLRALRRLLWRYLRVPLPALPGWRERLQAVEHQTAQGEVPRCAETGVTGAPIQWTTFRVVDGKIAPEQGLRCAWTRHEIRGVPTYRADGTVNGDAFGVRCARCGVPLSAKAAGMRWMTDVPSCIPCRSTVSKP